MDTKDLRLTPEMLEKLKGSIGFDIRDTFVYVPLAFRENGIPKSLWPVFTLKSKDGLEIAEVEDKSGYIEYKDNASYYHSCSGSHRVAILEKGIKKIKGLPLENGTTFLDYDGDTLLVTIRDGNGVVNTKKLAEEKEIVRYINTKLQVELQNAINERSTLTEEERRGLEF